MILMHFSTFLKFLVISDGERILARAVEFIEAEPGSSSNEIG